MSEELNPVTREEMFLAKAAGQNTPELTPITRVERFLQNLIDHVKSIGTGGTGGGGATPDWNAAEGEPGHVLNRTHWVETGIVEIPVTGEWQDNDNYAIFAPMGLEAGKSYVVTWDGINYEVTAIHDFMDDIPCVILGNFTGETDEPFVIAELDAETAAEIGFYGVAIPAGTEGFVDFSIHGEGEIVHPIPEKYLPQSCILYVNGSTNLAYKTKDTSNRENALLVSELKSIVNSGKTIYLYGTGEEGTVTYMTVHSVVFGEIGDGIGGGLGYLRIENGVTPISRAVYVANSPSDIP